MTREEKRIKIAQACGWKLMQPHDKSILPSCGWPRKDSPKSLPIPDYFGSLDAMRKAEDVLTDWQFDSFQIELTRIVFNHSCAVTYPVGFKCRAFWRATAEQRAEAFGLALGLWKEGE